MKLKARHHETYEEEPVPAGYRTDIKAGDRTMVCTTCSAIVANAREHSAWHQRLWERLGGEI